MLWLACHLGIRARPRRPLPHPRGYTGEARGLTLRAFVLNVMSNKIYTWTGNIALRLVTSLVETCR